MTFPEVSEGPCMEMYYLGLYDGMAQNFFRYKTKINHLVNLVGLSEQGNFVFTCSCGDDTMSLSEIQKHKEEND